MSEFPRPALVVDLVVRQRQSGAVLLIRRGGPPYEGMAALPGGFVNWGETVERAAVRELAEETGIAASPDLLTLVGVYSDPARDPRGWIVSVAFSLWVPHDAGVHAGDDAAHADWYPTVHLPPLAFDHDRILDAAL